MPGLLRKLFIFANKDGLILEPHGTETQHSILIEYGSRKLSSSNGLKHVPQEHDASLESHGIIGLISVATFSYLIAITRRRQVAQIFGKPVYVITDVALIPLSSPNEAREAILAASQHRHDDQPHSSGSDTESDGYSLPANEPPSSPLEDEEPYSHENKSGSSIVENVAKRKASFGKFASQWFSKQAWTGSKSFTHSGSKILTGKHSSRIEPSPENEAAETNIESIEEIAEKENSPKVIPAAANTSAVSLLPKILRSTKLILSSKSFYFSYDVDLTNRLLESERRLSTMARDKYNSLYFWNRRLGYSFLEAGHDAFLVPIIQGFVGQRNFSISAPKLAKSSSEGASGDVVAVETTASEDVETKSDRQYLLTLISRRSTKRSGLRYLRRGIDDEGNCANSVETEQILSSASWDLKTTIRSFVQIRGSIPLYFSQSPYSLKPAPQFHNTPNATEAAFKKHFKDLQERYGAVQIAVLVDKHGTEAVIGNAFEKLYSQARDDGQLGKVEFKWFDFHHECRGMKFENVQLLVDELRPKIEQWGETVLTTSGISTRQEGVVRTNCMDCLDRTNVAQSAFGQYVLQRDLANDGYEIDLLHDNSTNWFNILWADNGDAISRQYASTAALKGDFTRTRKRNWRGQMNDLGLTLSRYYNNMVNDYFSQAVIDLLLANVSWRVFEDFESTMMSADPGISVESARETAIENCAKIVIQEDEEDLIHGWTMLSPAQDNTLRTLPFEETVVLLTNAALYCCKFDWTTEKVARFEKVDLQCVNKIRVGTYITSTFTEQQLDTNYNQGLVVTYTPGKGSIIRVNTRSLQNSVATENSSGSARDGGTGILSWLAPTGPSAAPRSLALKLIPQDKTIELESRSAEKRAELPNEVAVRMSEEIKRAIIGADSRRGGDDIIENADIISVEEAKKRTGYLEQLGHSIKKMVWT